MFLLTLSLYDRDTKKHYEATEEFTRDATTEDVDRLVTKLHHQLDAQLWALRQEQAQAVQS